MWGWGVSPPSDWGLSIFTIFTICWLIVSTLHSINLFNQQAPVSRVESVIKVENESKTNREAYLPLSSSSGKKSKHSDSKKIRKQIRIWLADSSYSITVTSKRLGERSELNWIERSLLKFFLRNEFDWWKLVTSFKKTKDSTNMKFLVVCCDREKKSWAKLSRALCWSACKLCNLVVAGQRYGSQARVVKKFSRYDESSDRLISLEVQVTTSSNESFLVLLVYSCSFVLHNNLSIKLCRTSLHTEVQKLWVSE